MYRRRKIFLISLLIGIIFVITPYAFSQNGVEVGKIAEVITVRIDYESDEGNGGSGVIVAKNGNNYTVLTNCHVIEKAEGIYNVVTFDETKHRVNTSASQCHSQADLAVIEFNSNTNYQVATIGDSSQVIEGIEIYVSGWSGIDPVTPVRPRRFVGGEVIGIQPQARKGYTITHNAVSRPGMSGGPILNSEGILIGINGLAFTEPNTGVIEFYGIPINTYTAWQGRQPNPVATAPIPTPTPPTPTPTLTFPTPTPPPPTSTPTSTPPTSNSTPTNSFSFEIAKVNSSGQIIERETRQASTISVDLGNGVSMDFVAIPGGTFTMGSPPNEKGRYDDEGPQHEVTVQPFYMGKYEVTQAQYQAIMGENPSSFKGDNRPVERVSWDDAVKFCKELSTKIGKTVRLPSEAEWEYATRAGTTTPFYFGSTLTGDLANYRATRTYASESEGVYRRETTPVGQFPPNAFGLYDLHGNVWEWVEDDWHQNYQGVPNDGSAWVNNSITKVVRGGSWDLSPWYCRSAYRDRWFRDDRINFNGFRVVLVSSWE